MNAKQIRWSLVLAAFLAFTGWAFFRADLLDLIMEFLRNPVGLQVGLDLCMSMFLLLGFIWKDAKKRGINPVPYCVLGVLLGSISPLIYMIHRGFRPELKAG